MSEDIVIPEDDKELFLAGLDDFDETEDGTIPRMNVVGDGAVFVDSLSGAEHNPLDVILLGMKKQRVLWPATMRDEPGPPFCKAVDPKLGGKPGEEFPWNESGFTFDPESDDLLPCDSCRLKDWGSHPINDSPWCTEQYVFPAMIQEEGQLVPVILTFQRATLTAARKYVQSFARTKTPLFTAWTTISLEQNKRGSVEYATAKFKKSDSTDKDDWRGLAESFRSIESFLTRVRDDDPAELETAVNPAPSRAKPKPPPVSEIDDNDIPFDG